MILYHGSENIIKTPQYKVGRPYNDYGLGFYCTEFPDSGREWAVTSNHDGYLNSYEFDKTGLSVLDLNDYHILTWLSVLLQNRSFSVDTPLAAEGKRYLIDNFSVDYEAYDVIEGYRADDSYFSFAQDFINNVISLDQLKKAMYLGGLGNQVVLKSEKAFAKIRYLDSECVDRSIWLEKREKRDAKARDTYFSVNRDKYVKDAIYIISIIDKEMKPDDSRIQ